MKATKAYIASLGTTGVLLAASILMLAVVSAVVAFDRWPDGQVSSRVRTLVLAERPASIRVSAHALGAAGTAATRTAGSAVGTAPRGNPGAGGVAGQRFSGGTRTPALAPAPAHPATPVVPGLPKAPALPSTDAIPDLISNPATTAGQVADGAQSVTDTASVSLAKVNPDLGTAVAGTGQTIAQTVRALPLPGH